MLSEDRIVAVLEKTAGMMSSLKGMKRRASKSMRGLSRSIGRATDKVRFRMDRGNARRRAQLAFALGDIASVPMGGELAAALAAGKGRRMQAFMLGRYGAKAGGHVGGLAHGAAPAALKGGQGRVLNSEEYKSRRSLSRLLGRQAGGYAALSQMR